jgi:hypothetical protein
MNHSRMGISLTASILVIVAILAVGIAVGVSTLGTRSIFQGSANPLTATTQSTSTQSPPSSSTSMSLSSSSISSQTQTTQDATTTSSSSSTTTSTSSYSTLTTSTTIQGNESQLGDLKLVSFGGVVAGNDWATFDQVNGETYALVTTAGYNPNFWIVRNGTIVGSVSDGYNYGNNVQAVVNSSGGQVYEASSLGGSIQNCPSALNEITDSSVVSNVTYPSMMTSGYTGALGYDSQNGYLYAGMGGFSGIGYSCGVGILVLKNAWNWSDSAFITLGPRPNAAQNAGNWPLPIMMAFDSSNGNLYVAAYDQQNGPDTTVYVINGLSLLSDNALSNYTLAGYTKSLLYDPANQYLYFEQSFSNGTYSIAIVNPGSTGGTDAQIATIPLSSVSPMVYDSGNKMVYVFEQYSIIEISNSMVVQSYSEPTGNQIVYAADYDSEENEIVDFY